MGESAGKEIANLYTRGVNQGYEGQPLQAQYLLDLLDVFGEVGVRMYLVGILEGEEDAEEEEAAADPDAVEVIVDYETGEVTHIERTDADEDAPWTTPTLTRTRALTSYGDFALFTELPRRGLLGSRDADNPKKV